jgi:NAD-dependent dihydropyrimidine dehydrogenase PreA subunit
MPSDPSTNRRLTVVISQGQSRNPQKREVEETIAARAILDRRIDAVVIPHLYDLAADSESFQRLRKIDGPMVVLGWLFPRAIHWVLDRQGIRGQFGDVELKDPSEEEEDLEEETDEAVAEEAPEQVAEQFPRPDRNIYCLDLKIRPSADAFLEEIERITRLELGADIAADANHRFQQPTNQTALAIDGSGRLSLDAAASQVTSEAPLAHQDAILVIDEHPQRRWYPVIDFSRCTNCMECIDFCLFGVYGVDAAQTILVEQPDNCRKGCPACSRVCPANAIIFPQHKTPAIAGAQVDSGGFKIDLSKLFGAPERDEDPLAAAARERDEQLILAGRSAVGLTAEPEEAPQVSSAPAATAPSAPPASKDALDSLLDQLDQMDL